MARGPGAEPAPAVARARAARQAPVAARSLRRSTVRRGAQFAAAAAVVAFAAHVGGGRCRAAARRCGSALGAGQAFAGSRGAGAHGRRGPSGCRRAGAPRLATDPAAVPDVWTAGPAEVYSGQAKRVLCMLKDDPAGFDEGLEEELLALREQRDGEEERRLAMDRASEKAGKDQLALRKRVEEVQEKERLRTVTELLYLKVCARFKKLQVPLIPPLKEGGDVKFGGVDLKGLTTDIYSEDALQLVREHLFRIIGQEGSNSVLGDIAIVRLALFQVGQVYALSSLFGYYLRRVDSRYQLEKLAGSLGVWDADAAAPAQEDLEAVQSLKDYINTFGPEEVHQMRSIASVEAQMAMESQVSALFGNLRVLKERLISALDLGAGSDSAEEVERKLEQAIKNNEVESVRITSDNLRRLVLEAVAYGAALNDAEKQVDSLYELTPLAGRPRGSLTGDDEGAGRYLPE